MSVGRKNDFFWIFLVFLKSSHQHELFSYSTKFHIFNGLDLKKNVFFRLIIFFRTKKSFLKKKFLVAPVYINAQLFCYYTFFVSVTVRKIIGYGRTDIRTYRHTEIVDHRGSVDRKKLELCKFYLI